MMNLTIGNNNTAIGSSSSLNTGATLTTGSNNTFIGASARTSLASISDSTAIGYNAITTASNQIVLGTVTESVIIPRNIRYSSSPMFTRYLTGTQSIPNGSTTIVNFNNADARNGSYTGITYSAGTFTNSNSYSITVTVCACILFVYNTVGEREAVLEHSSQGRVGGFAMQPSAYWVTQGTLSATFVLNASESFYIAAYQTSGGSLNITNTSRCSVLVM